MNETMKVKNLNSYKSHSILTIENELGWMYSVVIGASDFVFDSVADAKRYIDDSDYEPIDATVSGIREFVEYANERFQIDGGLPEICYKTKYDC